MVYSVTQDRKTLAFYLVDSENPQQNGLKERFHQAPGMDEELVHSPPPKQRTPRRTVSDGPVG